MRILHWQFDKTLPGKVALRVTAHGILVRLTVLQAFLWELFEKRLQVRLGVFFSAVQMPRESL